MASLSFTGTGTSGTAQYASSVNVTISNPNGANIKTITIKFSACVSNGGPAANYTITYLLNGSTAATSSTYLTNNYSSFQQTLTVPSSISTNTTFTLTLKVSSSSYPPVFHSISHVSNTENTPTKYSYTIKYYTDGSLYDTWSDTSTNTTYSVALPSVPKTWYYDDEDNSTPFTITGDVNTGVGPNKTCIATEIPRKKVAYSGWYSGRYATSGKVSSPVMLAKNETLSLNATSTTTTEEYLYKNNTIQGLGTPTKSDLIETTTVTFDPNGGSVSPTEKKSTKTTTYPFNGWWNATNGGSQYSSSYQFIQATTVYAQWTTSVSGSTTVSSFPDASRSATNGTYTVKFVDSDGSTTISSNKTNSYSITYTFNGWYTAKTGGTKKTSSSSSTTLYARWTQNAPTYTSITLPTPSKTGYNFAHWTDTSTNKNYSAGASYTPSSTGTSTLKAVWAASTYEVKYNGNGHTSGSMSNSIHTIGVSSNLSANTYKKEYILSFDSIHIENTENNTFPSLLPSEYTQLEYIQANYNQCLDTGYNFKTNNVKVYMEYTNLNTDSIISYTGNKVICGAEDDTPSTGNIDMCGGSLYTVGSAESFAFDVGNGASKLYVNIPREQKLTIEINCTSDSTNYSTYSISINGQQQDIQSATACFRNQYNYYVFADNQFGTPNMPSAGNLYRFTMYDNDFSNPVRDFIPCKRNSDNAIGVYDLIEKNFHQSITNTSFIAGNEINSDNEEDEIITYDGIKVTYSHNGWYSNPSCTGDPITQAYNLTTAGNVYNVYAKWIQNSFTLPIPEKKGYTFLGWYDSQGNHIVNNSLITSNLALTAQWIKNETNKKIIIYTNNDWKKAIALIYKNNTWKEYDFNIK